MMHLTQNGNRSAVSVFLIVIVQAEKSKVLFVCFDVPLEGKNLKMMKIANGKEIKKSRTLLVLLGE
jgi:hypothetical protein